MIEPDDPRHGSTRGFFAGCEEECCRRARARYEKRGKILRARGEPLAVPVLGAQRRIKALMALGWTSTDIALAGGWSNRGMVLTILNGQHGKPSRYLRRQTHATICRVYDELSMKLPPDDSVHARTRIGAARKGYYPPLAWDDDEIDNPRARARRGSKSSRKRTEVDPAIVERVLAGEVLDTTKAERLEIMRTWLARGRSEKSLCDRMGWQDGRYLPADREDVSA